MQWPRANNFTPLYGSLWVKYTPPVARRNKPPKSTESLDFIPPPGRETGSFLYGGKVQIYWMQVRDPHSKQGQKNALHKKSTRWHIIPWMWGWSFTDSDTYESSSTTYTRLRMPHTLIRMRIEFAVIMKNCLQGVKNIILMNTCARSLFVWCL